MLKNQRDSRQRSSQDLCEEEPLDSSDTESLCRIKKVGAVEDKQKCRHIRCIKVENCEFQV